MTDKLKKLIEVNSLITNITSKLETYIFINDVKTDVNTK